MHDSMLRGRQIKPKYRHKARGANENQGEARHAQHLKAGMPYPGEHLGFHFTCTMCPIEL